MLTKTRYEHITLTTQKVPIVADTNMKVIELVLARLAYGWSPEELQFQFPQLSLGQIHSALAYYWDHQDELDQDIEQRLERVDQLQTKAGTSDLVTRLRKKGLL